MNTLIQVLSLLVIFLVSSVANSADLPKYTGEMQSCKSYAFPGNTILEFAEWQSEKLIEVRDNSSSRSVAREIFEGFSQDTKSDLDEYRDMFIWGKKEAVGWAIKYIAYKQATAVARGVDLESPLEFTPLMMDVMNHIIDVWKEIGFLPQGNLECDINAPDTVIARWTPAGWESTP